MALFTSSQKEVISKLGDFQKEELNVIESIININEDNKEITAAEIIYYANRNEYGENSILIMLCINTAITIRPKSREYLLYLFNSLKKNSVFDYCDEDDIEYLSETLQKKTILQRPDCIKNPHIYKNIFSAYLIVIV